MIRRQSRVNLLRIDTPDGNSCDVFRKCPLPGNNTGLDILSVTVSPDPVYPGQLRTVTVTLNTEVIGAPLTYTFLAPAGVDDPPQQVSVAVQAGQTVGTGTMRAPWALFSGVLLAYPASGLPANPRVDTAPAVTPFDAPVPYELVDISVSDAEVFIGEDVTYTFTINAPNASDFPLTFNVSGLPDQDPVSVPVSIAPGASTGQATVSFSAAGAKTGNVSAPIAQIDTGTGELPEVLVVDPLFDIPSYGPDQPLIISHSGGALLAPEYTMEAYNRAVADGSIVLEVDTHLLSDGAVANWHDDTVDVRTTGTGPVSGFDTAGWAALDIDAGVWFGGGFSNTMHPIRVQQLIDAQGTDVLYVVEVKDNNVAEVIDLLAINDIPVRQVLIASFDLADLVIASAEGYDTSYSTSTATPLEISDALAAGVDWVNLSVNASDADFAAWIAAGIKVLAWSVNRQHQYQRVMALGASGIFSDDPIYATRTSGPLRTTDNFGTQQWDHGMISNLDFWSAVARGRFTAADYWGFPANAAATNTVLQGYLSPIDNDPNNPSFTMDFSVTFDAANAGDQTRHAIVFIGKNDKPYNNVVPTLAEDQGFNFVMPKNGNLNVYRLTTGGAVLALSVPTTAIADGAEAHYRITYAPAGVTLQRLNASGGTPTHTANVPDTDVAYRGGYVHFGRVGLACRFRNVTVT